MTSLFRQGWKAEELFGDDVSAHHMNTRSFYTFRANDKIGIVHEARYVDDNSSDTVDRFTVTLRTVHSYHERGTEAHSTTSNVGVYDEWLKAYYHALELIRENNRVV